VKRAHAVVGLLALGLLACKPPADTPPPRSTLVVGLDISGSFRKSGQFDPAMRYASLYIYAHVNALGGLKQATDVFVGFFGWRARRTTQNVPSHSGSERQVAGGNRGRPASLVPRRGSDHRFQRLLPADRRPHQAAKPGPGSVEHRDVFRRCPRFPGAGRLPAPQLYAKIDVSPIEYLSRNVTIRLLYAQPTVAQNWEKLVPRNRVKIWTQDEQVMAGWRRHEVAGVPLDRQDSLWSWTQQIVDFRVRRGKIL